MKHWTEQKGIHSVPMDWEPEKGLAQQHSPTEDRPDTNVTTPNEGGRASTQL